MERNKIIARFQEEELTEELEEMGLNKFKNRIRTPKDKFLKKHKEN